MRPRALSPFLLLLACEPASPPANSAASSPTAASLPAAVTPLDRAPHRRKGAAADIHLLARGRNAFLGKLEMAPGGEVPLHRDPTEEYIHILEGGGTFTIDGQAHAVGPGATIYMPPNAEVTFKNGDARLVAIQVFAGPEPAAKYDAWTPVTP